MLKEDDERMMSILNRPDIIDPYLNFSITLNKNSEIQKSISIERDAMLPLKIQELKL